MNIVINPSKCTATSITASNRIATWISSLLDIRLIDDLKTANIALQFDLDTVYIVNGIFGFCEFRDEIKKICIKAKRVVWVGNDYAIKIPSTLTFVKKDKKFSRIAQYSNFDNLPNHQYIDFNKLLHWNGTPKPYKYKGMFYYGAFREDRVKSFKHWLATTAYDVHVSTAQKNFKDFSDMNRHMKLYKPNGDIRKILPLFQSSIYIEDEFSHKNLMSPANRFYEVIGSKILMFYDVRSKRTLEHAGLWHDDFAVSNPAEVAEKLQDYETLRNKQIAMFDGKDFKKELTEDFLRIV